MHLLQIRLTPPSPSRLIRLIDSFNSQIALSLINVTFIMLQIILEELPLLHRFFHNGGRLSFAVKFITMLGKAQKANTSTIETVPQLHPFALQEVHGTVQITTWFNKRGINKE
jgi:hypothetical protein